MTIKKVRELVDEYRNVILCRIGVLGYSEEYETPKQLPDDMILATDTVPSERLSHYLFMCDQIVIFMESGGSDKKEKGMRWLGFLQGALWREGFYSLRGLKDHSREA